MSNGSSSSASGGGIGFVGLLTIAFIVLKLTNFISWSWWWVLSPLWISGGVAVVVIVAVLGFALIRVASDRRR